MNVRRDGNLYGREGGRMIPLERCPFCGGTALVGCIGTTTFVQCQTRECGAYVGVEGKEMVQQAVFKWNRRA